MNRTGTEYLTMRTVISDERSTRGVSIRPGSNGSVGNGASIGCSAAKSSPMVRIRSAMRR